jgi:ribose-phosphate pyrophosphokinase
MTAEWPRLPREEPARTFLPGRRLRLYSGRANPALAQRVAAELDVRLGEAHLVDFACGEIGCRLEESVRGSDTFVIQSHCGALNTAIVEQLLMIDAARRASARSITAVCPLYGYSRQDRKATGREPISARLVADLLSAAGADRILSVDLHTGQIQGFFAGPVDHLTAMPLFVDYLRANLDGDVVVVSPDAGRVKTAERLAHHLGAGLAVVHKTRLAGKVNAVEARDVVGRIAGKSCVVVDDMIHTGGTICAAARLLHERGAAEVLAVATHGILSDAALDRLDASPLARVVITDTVPLPPRHPTDKIHVLSVAGVIAAAIRAVFSGTSVSQIFAGENL